MPDLTTLGKWIIVMGLALTGLGALVWLVGKTGLPLGRLPGDIRIERGNFSFYFPIATSILISLSLTILVNVMLRLFKK